MEQISNLQAYMWALVVLTVAFILAVVFSNMVLYKPNDTGTAKRRIIFWVLGILTCTVSFVINFFIAKDILINTFHADYIMHSGIASGTALVLYIVLGFIICKIFNNSKCGTWF